MKVRVLVGGAVLLAAAIWAGCGSRNPATAGTDALAAPSELTAEPLGAGLHLRWKDNSTNEEDFELERRGEGGSFATLVIVSADGIQYHDEGALTAGASYSYRVRARTAAIYSPYSNEATGVAPGVTVGAGDGGTDGGVVSDAGVDAGNLPDGGTNQPPSCVVTAPVSATTVNYDAQVTFVASASDPEEGTLSGGSIVWRSNLSTPPLGTGASFTRSLPLPGVHTVSCTATDSAGLTGTSSIVITARSPVAVLNHPGDGEVRPASQNIPFVGDGRDFEDGPLPDAGLVWTSSLDGTIGTGRTFSRQLSAGTNAITLTVTDSQGNTAAQTITLTITP